MMGNRIIKFIISGGTAAFVDLLCLYIFTDLFRLWYLLSAVLAFVIAFIVNFNFQKFWTFKGDHEKQGREQLVMFLIINLINLSLNSLGMYLLVERVGIWYLLSQFLMSGILAFESYFVYRLVIFKHRVENNI